MDETATDQVQDFAPAPRPTDRIKLLTIANLGVLGAVIVVGSISLLSKSRADHGPTPTVGVDADDVSGAMVVRDVGPAGDGKRWYDISYTATLRNKANVDLIVPWSLDELFVGEIAPAMTGGAAFINAPPAPNGDAPQGAVKWRLIGSQASYLWTEEGLDVGSSSIDENDITNFLDEAHIPSENANSGLIGLYGPGRTNAHTAHFHFEALPGQYASVMVSYGTTTHEPMFGDPPDYLWDTRRSKFETVLLGDATAAKCSLGIIIENAIPRDGCSSGAALAAKH